MSGLTASKSFWDMLSSHTKVAGGPSSLGQGDADKLVVEKLQRQELTKEERVLETTLFITSCGM